MRVVNLDRAQSSPAAQGDSRTVDLATMATSVSRFAPRSVTFACFLAAVSIKAIAGGPKAHPQTALRATPAVSTLAPGTVLELRLDTPVSTKTSQLRGPITAHVIRQVAVQPGNEAAPGCQKVAIPLGATLGGNIEKLIPSSNPSDRARVLLRFTRLEIPGRPPLAVAGRVKGVENARETTLPDGTVRGVLADELPLGRLEAAMARMGQDENSEQLRRVVQQILGRSDTSIEFPVGTDFEWVLEQPLAVEGGFEPSVPATLARGNGAAVNDLLRRAPQRATSKEGTPGDPLNLVIIGSASQMQAAFGQAGWFEARQRTRSTVWETALALIAARGYNAAPVSNLYLYGRPQDLVFEKMLNTFERRHHLRLWRSPQVAPDGREIWVGAATHDIGFEIRPGVVSHAIDPNLDAERAKVGWDLAVTGRVAAETLLSRSDPLTEGFTATGGSWKTDGRLLAIELKPGERQGSMPVGAGCCAPAELIGD